MAPDEHELEDPKIRALLNDIAGKIGSALPKGYGFTLFLFNYDNTNPQLFYISSAQRAEMLQVIYEFISRQHILMTGEGSEEKAVVAMAVYDAIAALQKQPMFRHESDVLIDCANRMKDRGGSFVKALSDLYFMADGPNQQRLLASFANYFVDYAI